MPEAQLNGELIMIISSKEKRLREAYQGWVTRPDLSPEQEAELSGQSVDKMLALRQALDDANGGDQRDQAWDAYVSVLSIPISDAALPLGVSPDHMLKSVRQGWTSAFKHRNRWRIWLFDFRVRMDSGMAPTIDPPTWGRRRRSSWVNW